MIKSYAELIDENKEYTKQLGHRKRKNLTYHVLHF